MQSSMRRGAAALAAGFALFAMAGPAPAQTAAAEIARCLCLRQEVDRVGADLAARQRAADEAGGELARLDAQLQRERTTMDVNNPEAVARFRQLLERRDAAFRRSSGAVQSDVAAATERYNARVGDYNASCANRPQNSALVAQVQATLACAPPR